MEHAIGPILLCLIIAVVIGLYSVTHSTRSISDSVWKVDEPNSVYQRQHNDTNYRPDWDSSNYIGDE